MSEPSQGADDARPVWIGRAAHALRNHLNALGSAADVLGLDGVAPHVRERARGIVTQQLQHLSQLAACLADLADDGQRPQALPVDLVALASSALEWERADAVATGRCLLHDLQPASVRGEPVALERALRCLLRWQLQAVPPQGTVVLRVSAQGQTAQVQLLATPGTAQRSPPLDHVALGLALAEQTVARHAGTLVRTHDAKGSTVTLRLPLVSAGARPRTAAPRRVALVEDTAPVRAELAGALRQDGHEVLANADGAAGLQCLLAHWPDAAVIDLGLPGMTGLDLARHARRHGYAGRLVAISAYGSGPGRQEALRHGFDAHLTRPFTTAQLRAALAD